MANIYNINIDQGTTHVFSVTYKDSNANPIDLTLYSASLQVRTSYTASSANIFLRSPSGIVFGGSDEYVICATPITSTISVFASMSMREY